MFVSVKYLHDEMGVDEKIARFFVDRKIPENNSFWKKRLLYIGRGNGYISIPAYYDLLFRLGVSRDMLLNETHVQFMEWVMHYAILVEQNEISFNEQLTQITKVLEGRIKNEKFFHKLVAYLEQPVLKPLGYLGMEIPSLNRADVFLFILCDLLLNEEQTRKAVESWYALHTSYLLMDDMCDYNSDKEKHEENSVMELGDGNNGFDKAFERLKKNIEFMRKINPVLADLFEQSAARLHEFIQ